MLLNFLVINPNSFAQPSAKASVYAMLLHVAPLFKSFEHKMKSFAALSHHEGNEQANGSGPLLLQSVLKVLYFSILTG